MKDYYFTFGSNHRVHQGNDLIALNNHWVRITAESYGTAREIFVEQFSTPFMERGAACWSFQYEEDKFNKSYFPLGEYGHINQEG